MAALAYNDPINGRKFWPLAKVFKNPSVNIGKPTVLVLSWRLLAVWQTRRS